MLAKVLLYNYSQLVLLIMFHHVTDKHLNLYVWRSFWYFDLYSRIQYPLHKLTLSGMCVYCVCVCREAGERPSGAAPPLVQSSLALLQIQPDQLQDRSVALCDHFLRKLDPSPKRPPKKSRDWSPLLWMWQAASLFFCNFFLYIFITRQSWMYADLHCAHASVQNKCS